MTSLGRGPKGVERCPDLTIPVGPAALVSRRDGCDEPSGEQSDARTSREHQRSATGVRLAVLLCAPPDQIGPQILRIVTVGCARDLRDRRSLVVQHRDVPQDAYLPSGVRSPAAEVEILRVHPERFVERPYLAPDRSP